MRTVMKHDRQQGVTTIEFAVVGVTFFMVLLGVIEFGRGLFVWNSLTEVTRRAARIAAVCPIGHGAIPRVSVFDAASGSGDSPIVFELDIGNVEIQYLDSVGSAIADPVGNFGNIRFVRGRVVGYQHRFLIPFVGDLTIDTPAFETTIPRESLGIPREGENPVCFGTAS